MEVVGRLSALQLVLLICAAQVLIQIGAFVWPALLPDLVQRWSLTYGEAGWITGIFYGAYIVAVPVLVTLTDRIDAKRVYLFGVAATALAHGLFALLADGLWVALAARALAGIGWAGTYMTGLKLLADKVDARLMSRAAAGHAASIGIAGAVSFAYAAFLADLKTQSAVLHQLLILGEAAKRLSQLFRDAHAHIPWPLITGMRDKLIHHYDVVDLGVVWETIQ